MRVLIVDDDALVCSSLKIILEKDPDITVVGIGNNGEDAVGLYNYLAPDVLLMDIRMEVPEYEPRIYKLKAKFLGTIRTPRFSSLPLFPMMNTFTPLLTAVPKDTF